ncbi:MAG: hypothetical protein PHV33_14215 [Elusimicrobiales bacterium]|nr:hypothetical protein [Elusimicrobiales bacterium]
MKNRKGQLLLGVIAMLVVLAIVVPAMVKYIQNEVKWSEKQAQNSNAFQLAEGAVDRAYQKLVESTSTWKAVKDGLPLAGFNFDAVYSDLPGGTYTISISSGPDLEQATILAVGRDKQSREARALKVVYANAAISQNAIRSLQGVSLSGSNEQVEWGSVLAPGSIDSNNRNHPQFYSASSIIGKDTSASPPNTDSVQWWSYYPGIPQASSIDIDAYRSSATLDGTYYGSSQTWGSGPGSKCDNAVKCNTGKTYFIEGDLTVKSNGIYVGGNLIITGNLNLPNGRSGQGSPTIKMPRTAWKQYGNDWDYYKDGGPACGESWNDTTPSLPDDFPGINDSYRSDENITMTVTSGKAITNGFIYVGGNITTGGGAGQSIFVGAAYVVGTVTLGSNNICFFYTDEAAKQILTTDVRLTRQSWLDSRQTWPAWLP